MLTLHPQYDANGDKSLVVIPAKELMPKPTMPNFEVTLRVVLWLLGRATTSGSKLVAQDLWSLGRMTTRLAEIPNIPHHWGNFKSVAAASVARPIVNGVVMNIKIFF